MPTITVVFLALCIIAFAVHVILDMVHDHTAKRKPVTVKTDQLSLGA